ncbi:MAG: ABC transporter permease [Bacteroidetes bacterium]|nr:ABC transporter permease [Bacteroidota bacterium]MBL6943806.1 ABC transporter permease [Bacteroidales bacterium]
MERYFLILSISLEAVFTNKFRSVLTALGIIFGVAAVIAMLAIGNGARQEILEQIKLVGLNNIIITPKVTNEGEDAIAEGEDETKLMSKKFSPGLTLRDAENILLTLPTVEKVSPEIVYSTPALRDGKNLTVNLSGVTSDYFSLFNQTLKRGSVFSKQQMEMGAPVCVIGPEVVAKLFPKEDPLGKQLKCGTIWLKVIGVLKGVLLSEKAEEMGVSNYNKNVYVPIKTLLLRYKDRSLVAQSELIGGGSQLINFGGNVIITSSSENGGEGENQLSKIVVQVKESSQLSSTTKAIEQILTRRHMGVDDFEITIPELLLKQEQKTKDIFNIVLGAIAGISLIVGGIGIMNIMLASVMERIREIGVRRAIGATKNDIVFQFLAEATFISITGGLIGILFGVIMAKIITASTDILTIVSFGSILLSFGVAATVGIIFGWLPAKKAAEQDPLESLRHD